VDRDNWQSVEFSDSARRRGDEHLVTGNRSGATANKPSTYLPVDESCDRLHRAGWSLGETCFGSTRQVDGNAGENRLLATGASQAVAWYRAPCWRSV
jgi:hypothetical protein